MWQVRWKGDFVELVRCFACAMCGSFCMPWRCSVSFFVASAGLHVHVSLHRDKNPAANSWWLTFMALSCAMLHVVTMLLFPCSDESNFHFSRQVKGMKRDVQPWMIRGDQPRVDLVGSRRGCRWINYNDTVNNMHRAVNRVDMVTVLEAYSKTGAEKETCPKKNRFKKPIQQTCFMKRIQENCTCFTICCVTWEPSCWNSASREVVLCLASWSWPHPTRANTSAPM